MSDERNTAPKPDRPGGPNGRLKCPRPGCDNPAIPSKGRCWDPYCEGWLAAAEDKEAAGDT